MTSEDFLARYESDGGAGFAPALTEWWLAEAANGLELTSWDVAHVIVDHECSRGDYEGCSAELEMAFTEAKWRAAGVLGEDR